MSDENQIVHTVTSSRNKRFDRAIGALTGIPDVIKTSPTTIRTVMPLAGDSQTFIVQTFRQIDRVEDENEDVSTTITHTLFLEMVDDTGNIRMVIPDKVLKVILRQFNSLADRHRSKVAQAAADDRKARGIVPGFLRNKKGRKTK